MPTISLKPKTLRRYPSTGAWSSKPVAADTTGPTAPVISATPVGSTSVSIALVTPSTDDSGVASYAIERSPTGAGSWTVLNSAAVFPYTDALISPSTTYYYRVRATDASPAANVGSYSSVVSATTGAPASADGPAELPRTTVGTSLPSVTGTTHTPANASALATVLSTMALGDEVVLTPGVDYGSITWPAKSGSGWIIVRTSALPGIGIPLEGVRAQTSDTSQMPRFSGGAGNVPVMQFANGAKGYRFIGLHVQPNTGQYVNTVVSVTPFRSILSDIAQDIIFDRCVVRGDPAAGTRRCFAFDVIRGAIVDSYVGDAFEAGADSQAIWINCTPGPGLIRNSFLEGAGENVLFGGESIPIADTVPRDYTVVGNTLFKRNSWASGVGRPTVKNTFEIKNGERILFERNVLQNFWKDGQQSIIVLTPRNQYGPTPWIRVRDIVVRFNRAQDVWGYFVNLLYTDDLQPSQTSARIRVRDNLVIFKDQLAQGGTIRALQMLGNTPDVWIDHNTFVRASGDGDGSVTTLFELDPGGPIGSNFKLQDNIFLPTQYGIRGGAGNNNALLALMWDSPVNQKNAYIGITNGTTQTQLGGAANFYPSNYAAVQFVNYASGNYALAAASPFKNAASDGRDLGADISLVA